MTFKCIVVNIDAFKFNCCILKLDPAECLLQRQKVLTQYQYSSCSVLRLKPNVLRQKFKYCRIHQVKEMETEKILVTKHLDSYIRSHIQLMNSQVVCINSCLTQIQRNRLTRYCRGVYVNCLNQPRSICFITREEAPCLRNLSINDWEID